MRALPLLTVRGRLHCECECSAGELARELLFLLTGELRVLSPVFGDATLARITLDEETRYSTSGEHLFTRPHARTFGETVIVNMRRPETYVWSHGLTHAVAVCLRSPH